MLTQPEPIPTTPQVALSSLPKGLAGGFLFGPVNWPDENSQVQKMATAFPLDNQTDPATINICFPSTGAVVGIAAGAMVTPNPLWAGPKP